MVVGSLFCICERQRKGNASDNEADLIPFLITYSKLEALL